MGIHEQFKHSIIASTLVSTALLAACTQPKPATPELDERSATQAAGSEAKQDSAQPDATKPATQGLGIAVVETPIAAPIDAERADVLVRHGRAVVMAIDAALTAIDANQTSDAQAQLAEASATLAKIEAERPNIAIALEIWRGDQAITLAEFGMLDTIPLFAALSRADVRVYDRAEIEARRNQRQAQAADTDSTQDKSTDLEILDSNLVYEEVDMPIASTKIHVLAAQELLDEAKLDEAKATLIRALASFNVTQVIHESPEYRARALVWSARAAFVGGDLDQAQRLVAAARAILMPLTTGDEDPQGKAMVAMLLDELEPLEQVLAPNDADSNDAFVEVERDAMTLARRTALRAMLAARGESERFALADALMWLEKSQTEGLLDPNSSDEARRDLVRAQTMLSKAAAEAPPSAQAKLDDLEARVGHLVTLDAAKQRDPDRIKSELRSLSLALRMLMLDLGLLPPPTKPA